MAQEPERLYREWPVMGDGGECIHFGTESPPISINCNRVKDAIKQKRKFIFKEMMRQDSDMSVHLQNENIRNLEWLMITWESIHYNPRVKWNKDWLNQIAPNVYRIWKKKSYAVHWKNSEYELGSNEDFPPLSEPSDTVQDNEPSFVMATDVCSVELLSKMTYSEVLCIEKTQKVVQPLNNQKNEATTQGDQKMCEPHISETIIKEIEQPFNRNENNCQRTDDQPSNEKIICVNHEALRVSREQMNEAVIPDVYAEITITTNDLTTNDSPIPNAEKHTPRENIIDDLDDEINCINRTKNSSQRTVDQPSNEKTTIICVDHEALWLSREQKNEAAIPDVDAEISSTRKDLTTNDSLITSAEKLTPPENIIDDLDDEINSINRNENTSQGADDQPSNEKTAIRCVDHEAIRLSREQRNEAVIPDVDAEISSTRKDLTTNDSLITSAEKLTPPENIIDDLDDEINSINRNEDTSQGTDDQPSNEKTTIRCVDHEAIRLSGEQRNEAVIPDVDAEISITKNKLTANENPITNAEKLTPSQNVTNDLDDEINSSKRNENSSQGSDIQCSNQIIDDSPFREHDLTCENPILNAEKSALHDSDNTNNEVCPTTDNQPTNTGMESFLPRGNGRKRKKSM